MGGTKKRMFELAKYLRGFLFPDQNHEELKDISAAGHRYAIFKVCLMFSSAPSGYKFNLSLTLFCRWDLFYVAPMEWA